MKISKLIKLLTDRKKEYGDVDCYVNGEHGLTDYEVMNSDHIQISSACALLDTRDWPKMEGWKEKDDSDIICHIGGS